MDLKQKAEKLGFVSKIKLVHENLKSPDMGELESLLYYLWKCELQKWLREIHNIAVIVSFTNNNAFEFYYFIHSDISKPYSNRICSLPVKVNSYEKALEIGLQETLKLLPDGKKD